MTEVPRRVLPGLGVAVESWGLDLNRADRVEFPEVEGYLYIAGFESGLVKVGIARSARDRLRQHGGDGLRFGDQIARVWISPIHGEFRANEQALIGEGRRRASEIRASEYFVGLDFARLIRFARRLPFTAIDRDAARARRDAHLESLRSLLGLGREAPAWSGQYLAAPNRPISIGESAEEIFELSELVAERRGCGIDEVLDMDWIDLLEEMTLTRIRTDALQMRSYAQRSGRRDLLMSLREAMAACEVSGDPNRLLILVSPDGSR